MTTFKSLLTMFIKSDLKHSFRGNPTLLLLLAYNCSLSPQMFAAFCPGMLPRKMSLKAVIPPNHF